MNLATLFFLNHVLLNYMITKIDVYKIENKLNIKRFVCDYDNLIKNKLK